MRKLILILILLPFQLLSQYWWGYQGQRVTDQNFEQSEVFFKPYFLNTYGLKSIKDVSVGLIDDPFLNLFLNPSISPGTSTSGFRVYIDFRGSRYEPAVVRYYGVLPDFYTVTPSIYYPVIPSKFKVISVDESEPLFSIGVVGFPVRASLPGFYVGLTYQLNYKQTNFYAPPYYIYYPIISYDAVGLRTSVGTEVPVVERYAAQDQMIHRIHSGAIFAGYQINNKLAVGFSFSRVGFERDGNYGIGSNYYDYRIDTTYRWAYLNSKERTQEYWHDDFSGGISYKPADEIRVGFKVGTLKGNANQFYYSIDTLGYYHNLPEVSKNWYFNYRNANTEQYWNHDGRTRYYSFDLTIQFGEGKRIVGYFRNSDSKVGVSTLSGIKDTLYYSYRSEWYDYSNDQLKWWLTRAYSSAFDQRVGVGERNTNVKDGLLSFSWKFTERTHLSFAFYVRSEKIDVNISEDVIADRYSRSTTQAYNGQSQSYYRFFEDKMIKWENNARRNTFEIPVILNVSLSKSIDLTFGVIRVVEEWKMDDETLVIYKTQIQQDLNQSKVLNDFAERYREPKTMGIERRTTGVIGTAFKPSNMLSVKFLLEPNIEGNFGIMQWWIAFQATLF